MIIYKTIAIFNISDSYEWGCRNYQQVTGLGLSEASSKQSAKKEVENYVVRHNCCAGKYNQLKFENLVIEYRTHEMNIE